MDQLQLTMAKATALIATARTDPGTLHAFRAELERRILEHPDNRGNVVNRMLKQRGRHLDPESLHHHTNHGTLVIHTLPKPNGGQRIIHAPDDKDCANGLLHLAALTPAAEVTASHLDHGFRPLDQITTPVTQLVHAIQHGYNYIAQLDVENCFHHLPLTVPFTGLVPPRTLALLISLHHAWNNSGKGQSRHGFPQGLPQGHPLSPAYSNIVLNLIIAVVRTDCGTAATIIRYADDVTIVATNANDLRLAAELATRHLAEHGMAINPEKTTITQWKYGAKISYLGYRIEAGSSGITLAPKPSAYSRLRDKLENTTDPGRQLEIITGWLNAFLLTNKQGENTRAIDFIKSLQALRLHPHLLPAPRRGAAIHDTPPVACQSRFLDHLDAMVAARNPHPLPPAPPAHPANTPRLSDGGPHHIGPPTFAHPPGPFDQSHSTQ